MNKYDFLFQIPPKDVFIKNFKYNKEFNKKY